MNTEEYLSDCITKLGKEVAENRKKIERVNKTIKHFDTLERIALITFAFTFWQTVAILFLFFK